MSEEKAKETAGQDADKELSDLLDSALNDFGKSDTSDKSTEASNSTKDGVEEVDVSEEWSEEMIKQATSQLETNLAAMLGNMKGEPVSEVDIQESFKKMAEAAQQVLTDPQNLDDVSNNFADTITQTLRGLSEGRETLENPLSDQDIMNMFNPSGGESGNAFLPFMQGMMQSLLSKEVLYPSLKDILDKFPGWLAENDGTLSPQDKERFRNQQELMAKVCKELEEEKPEDSVDMKRTRFETVLGLMQKLQEYGQPPTDLVGEEMPNLQFDQLQNSMPNQEQCSVM